MTRVGRSEICSWICWDVVTCCHFKPFFCLFLPSSPKDFLFVFAPQAVVSPVSLNILVVSARPLAKTNTSGMVRAFGL